MSGQLSFVSGSLAEGTFNTALAEALKQRRHHWRTDDEAVVSERSDVILGEPALRPDIVIQPARGNPVALEIEIDSDPIPDASGRIGLVTKRYGRRLQTAIAVRAPAEVRGWQDHAEARRMLNESRGGARASSWSMR